jgi:nucleotide-binding universal stress UspA family protein
MAPRAIISYDDTPGDHDALIVGRILADAGVSLTLAYVRHCTCDDCPEDDNAATLLARGADRLAGLDVDTRVVVSASTPEGLCRLISEQHADIVVFGSDYRTPPGRVAPQHTTLSLLECGPAAVAIAPADYFGARIRRIGVISIPGDDTTLETARALADSYGAALTRDERQVDLLVVGSRLEAPIGHVLLSAQAQNEIENAACPVLIVPRGVSIDFPAVLAHAA